MGANAYVGLGLTSSGYGSFNTSTFEEVSVTRTDHSLPANWSSQDVGTASFTGSSRFYNDTFTFAVEASGQNVGSTSDDFHFAHRTMVGDGAFVARVAAMAGESGGAAANLSKAGVMFRAGTGGDARNVFLAISKANGAVWQNRATTGGNTSETWVSGKSAPHYVKVVRAGDAFTGYLSTDGSTWTQIGSTVTISGIGSSLEVGLALSAAGYGSLNTTTFDHVTLAASVPTLTAHLVHAGRIDLSWTDTSGSETGFVLQRSEDNGTTWTTLGAGGEIRASGFVDTPVDPAKTYKYRIRSFLDDAGARGESAWSSPLVSATTAGLGNGLSATYYDNIDFTGGTVTRTDEGLEFLWPDGQAPVGRIAANTFTADWTGQLLAPATGTYTFRALSDDGVRLWVNNQLVLNDWDVHAPSTRSGTIDLVANNKYDVRVEYFQHYGAAQIELKWVVPGAPTGTKSVSIPTANLYTTTSGQSPAAPAAPTDVYAAIPVALDAVTAPRIQVNWAEVPGVDAYVIYRADVDTDDWKVAGTALAGSGGFADNATGLDLSKHYRYRVVAVNAGGRSAPTEAIPELGEVTADATANSITLFFPRGLGPENVIVVKRSDDGGLTYAHEFRVAAGSKSFTDTTDIVPGHTYVYAFAAQLPGVSSKSGRVDVTARAADVTPANGLRARYHTGSAFEGTAPDRYREGDLSYHWGASGPAGVSPGADGAARPYSARFTGQIEFPAAGVPYTFTALADGGVHLWVDDQLVIDHWQDAPFPVGDATLDGLVDFNDLVRLAQNYGQATTLGVSRGDFDVNGVVDFNDLVKLAQNYNTGTERQKVQGQFTPLVGTRHNVRLEFFNEENFGSVELQWQQGIGNPSPVLLANELFPTSTDAPPAPPAAPASLAVTVASPTAVGLSWSAPAGATGLVLQRRSGPAGDFKTIANLPPTQTTYPDAGLATDLQHAYRLFAFNRGGWSTPAIGTASGVGEVATVTGSGAAEEGEDYDITFAPAAGVVVDGWIVDWGDGTLEELAAQSAGATHAYTDGTRTYVAQVAAVVAGIEVWSAPHEVAVANVAPSVEVVGPANAEEGVEVTFEAKAVDPAGAMTRRLTRGPSSSRARRSPCPRVRARTGGASRSCRPTTATTKCVSR